VTSRRRGVGLTPMETRRDVIVRTAVLADELGYEIFAVPEGWGLDSTPVLTEIALRTARIHLLSGVLSVWGRTPATLAMTAATLYQICGGRYLLGLGVSTKALAEGFHDTTFEHPAAKLRDAVTKVRALPAGQPAQLGQAPAARPLRLGQPPAPDLPIWVAALGHHTTRVAAELGDGWIPALAARDRFPGWTAQLKQLRDAAAPHARPLTVAAGPITAADENAGAARDIAAACTAWYLGAMGEGYARSMSGQGYAAEVQAIIARSSPRTRAPANEEGPFHPAPRSSSTSSPPTETAIRSASNSSPGITRPTSSPSCCRQACPGPTSKRPSWPQHQAPGRCAPGACPPPQPVRALPRWRPNIFR
jgi:alkanesulfonate monooxygenase SsuD/methylene tetrahydromethanopterin reductase-like flavin-dependent oxidoreductase (luciferase family)